MPPVTFVLLDGMAEATARQCMGFLRALEDAGQARYARLTCELPPLSRPLYATLLSGAAPMTHGIVHNADARPCPLPTIFSRARDAGMATAAAAYHWISEICNRAPFDAARDRLTDDATLPVSHGLFYMSDDYPDEEVFRDAAMLLCRHSPDLLLIHCMGADTAGHRHGAGSREYRNAARLADGLLARHLPGWLLAGRSVLVTSDHGMDADGMHNDDVPLPRRQTEVTGLVARLLHLP